MSPLIFIHIHIFSLGRSDLVPGICLFNLSVIVYCFPVSQYKKEKEKKNHNTCNYKADASEDSPSDFMDHISFCLLPLRTQLWVLGRLRLMNQIMRVFSWNYNVWRKKKKSKSFMEPRGPQILRCCVQGSTRVQMGSVWRFFVLFWVFF